MIQKKLKAVLLIIAMIVSMLPGTALEVSAQSGGAVLTLSTNSTHFFSSVTEGYGDQPLHQVNLSNTGTLSTGELTISLSGADPDAFSLTKTSITEIAAGGSDYFQIRPVTGLAAKTYTATVTVSGPDVEAKSFDVSFIVSSAGMTYTATVMTYIDNIRSDVTGKVELWRNGSLAAEAVKTETGGYTAAVPNGDYWVYVNGVDTGRGIAINGAPSSVEVDYYSVNFSTSNAGTTSESNITATANGVAIVSGSLVLKNSSLAITAKGKGAAGYTYAWNDANNTTGETLSIAFLKDTLNVICTVTGVGVPPTEPDYDINGEPYLWTGSSEKLILSGESDTLTIYKAPEDYIQLEIVSKDGSTVTVNGNSIALDEMNVVVSNNITLNLDNVKVTAPSVSVNPDMRARNALQLNKAESNSGNMTIHVTGECFFNGDAEGYGIASVQDQSLRITGSGTLHAKGGDQTSGTGGSGIFVNTYTYGLVNGAKLTIDGGVTVNASGGDSQSGKGGLGIEIAWGDLIINNATVSASGGTSTGASYGGTAISIAYGAPNPLKGGNVTIQDSTVTARGGASDAGYGGRGIDAFSSMSISGSSNLDADGGVSNTGVGGTALYAYLGELNISGGTVSATGGDGYTSSSVAIYSYASDINLLGGTITAVGGGGTVNGSHAIYTHRGAVNIGSGANVSALGGNGATGVGGVGIRAYGEAGGGSSAPGTVQIAANAGDVYVRGGQGATAKRDSIMGRAIYIATGNIDLISMEADTPHTIQNVPGGDEIYLVKAAVNPAKKVVIKSSVTGSLGNYLYRAPTKEDGLAALWLPAGRQTLAADGYDSGLLTVPVGGSPTPAITLVPPAGNTSEPPAPVADNGVSSAGSGAPAADSGANVIVNGKTQTAGIAETKKGSDGKTTTTVTVNSNKLETLLAAEGKGATVVIPVAGLADTSTGKLTGEMIKSMENQEATLVLRTDTASYTLPASQINISDISAQFGTGVSLKDITVAVSIAEPDKEMDKVVEDSAANSGYTIMVPAVDFTITCTYEGRTVHVNRFNSYVERTIVLPDGVDPSKITTGVVVDSDGKTHHVPTRVTVINGKYYAVINSLTNSTYSIIWNPIEFKDMEKHWAKDHVNNMGSRMVVTGIGNNNYAPERDLTRGEFAAIIVRALGLEPGMGSSNFRDVVETDMYSDYIKTAAEYGIFTGYPDGNFKPNDIITREQAMTIIARTMKITGLKSDLDTGEAGELLNRFADASRVSSYARGSIEACVNTGIINGINADTLSPATNITRVEAAVMVERLLKKSNLI